MYSLRTGLEKPIFLTNFLKMKLMNLKNMNLKFILKINNKNKNLKTYIELLRFYKFLKT